MSDRVALMDEGRIVQLGTPAELYHNPSDLRVARFIGSPQINIVSGTTTAQGVLVGDAVLPIAVSAAAGQVVSVGLRPEALSLDLVAGCPQIAARLTRLENLGAEVFLHFAMQNSGAPMVLRATLQDYERHKARLDAPVALSAECSRALVFNAAGHRVDQASRVAPRVAVSA